MRVLQRAVVAGLESACSATRFVEWVPGWHRVYPPCLFARWSAALDSRWGLGTWSPSDFDDWSAWFDALPAETLDDGHWHVL